MESPRQTPSSPLPLRGERRYRAGQFELPFRHLPKPAPLETTLWLLAATPNDSLQIARQLERNDRATTHLLSLFDGAPALHPGDVVAVKVGDDLQTFAFQPDQSGLSRGEVSTAIRAALAAQRVTRRPERQAVDTLLIRLWGNGRSLMAADASDGRLGQFIGLLQEADQERDAQIVAELSGSLLRGLPKDASSALDGLLSRLRARALVELHRRDGACTPDQLREADRLYRHASAAFARAGAMGHSAACGRYSRVIADLAELEAKAQPLLPGFQNFAAQTPHFPRLGYRATRCLAVPLNIRLPTIHSFNRSADLVRSELHPLGSVAISQRALIEILAGATSETLVPTVRPLRTLGDSRQRLRVSIEREHFSLLGVPDRSPNEAGSQFEVHLVGHQWNIGHTRGLVAPGRPFDVQVRPQSRQAPPLQIFVSDGRQSGRFEFVAPQNFIFGTDLCVA